MNISGLTVKNTDSNGMWINVERQRDHHVTEFDNIAFSNGTGNQLLQITPADALPGVERVHVRRQHHLRRQDGRQRHRQQTRALFGGATCATNTSGICATSEKSDDDANNNGDRRQPRQRGQPRRGGAVRRGPPGMTGRGLPGFPTAAFDWNTFTYYSTYAVFRNQAGGADVIYVRDEAGNPLYSWSTASNQDIVGTPQWTTTTSACDALPLRRRPTIAGNNDKVYRLVDTGTGTSSGTLTLDAAWSAWPAATRTTAPARSSRSWLLDANNIYWAAHERRRRHRC